jgi:signal transduction histidine kinase
LIYFYANVDSVLATPDGSLWWGGYGVLMHWQNHRLADCFTNESWLQNVAVSALQNDRHGGIWIGTGAGTLVHLRNGQFTEFPKQVSSATITSLAVQPGGALWVGTIASGLKLIHEATGAVASITNGLSSKSSIRTLYLDGDGTLWIGTAGGGLGCWRHGRVYSFSASQGLTPHTVSQIVEDDHGFLWLGCGRGIFRVNKRSLLDCADGKLSFLHCRSFGTSDGMLAEECSGGFCPAGLKTRSGLICISTVKGLVFLDPDKLHDETPPPKVLLEEALVGGKPQAFAPQDASGGSDPASPPPPLKLVLAPGTRDIELHYTAIEFAAPEKIGFRYKLDGLDRDWTEAGPRRVVNYQHLPPGDYTFHVQACNADGTWNENDTTLAVTALPFFWEKTWFHATSVLVMAGLLVGTASLLLRRRYRHRLERLQTLNDIARERLRISKDIHDHVGGVLTQVSQLSDLGLNETDDQATVKNRFERIGNRARVAVQALDEIVWATNPKNDNLASFAEYVSRFSDEFFEYTKVRCWQDLPAAVPPLLLRAELRHNVFLAVREALNNALKHAQCTEVWLRMKIENDQVTLEIEDNGAGFALEQTAPGGNGLANMQARLAESGGRTELASTPGKGTRVRFIFLAKPPVMARPQ